MLLRSMDFFYIGTAFYEFLSQCVFLSRCVIRMLRYIERLLSHPNEIDYNAHKTF